MKYRLIFKNKLGDHVSVLTNDVESSVKANSILGFKCVGITLN